MSLRSWVLFVYKAAGRLFILKTQLFQPFYRLHVSSVEDFFRVGCWRYYVLSQELHGPNRIIRTDTPWSILHEAPVENHLRVTPAMLGWPSPTKAHWCGGGVVLHHSCWHGVLPSSTHILISWNGLCLICHVPAKLLGFSISLSLTYAALTHNCD